MSTSTDQQESKYFAYFIPENKPILMNNILDSLKEEYDSVTANYLYDQIEANLYVNDWNTVIGENINQYLNSLVLVKFTLVNDVFVSPNAGNEQDLDANEDINNEIPNETSESDEGFSKNYKKIAENSVYHKTKYANKDYSQIKMNQILFSGTRMNNYEITDNIQYIFSEICVIPLSSTMNFYTELIFDSNGSDIFNKQFDMYVKKGDLTNKIIQNILKLANKILAPVKYSKTYENYRHLQKFIPLYTNMNNMNNANDANDANNQNDETNTIKELWEEYLCKTPEDPYEALRNHRLITNNDLIKITDDRNRFAINGYIFSKLYITMTKKFADITYKDAMPFKYYFNTKETLITDNSFKHNNIVDKISYLESRITNINRCKSKQTENIRRQNAELVKSIKEDIEVFKTSLSKMDSDYKNHILFHTQIGFRLTFNERLNAHKSLIYLRYVCNNKERLNRNILFKYEIMPELRNDVTYFYVKNDLIDDLISLKTKSDLFTISRLFHINMVERYQDDKFKINNHNIDTSHTLSCNIADSPALSKFDKFLEDNIALKLFEYQKNNVLWMLKTEDNIDANKLTVNSFVGDFEVNYDHIEDIKIYLHNLRAHCPEAVLKNYMISHNGKKSIIDIRGDATIAQYASITSILNAENYRHMSNYDYDFDIIKNILPHDEYIRQHSKPIQMCGGAICDEVGLGKTLSIITHLVVKMKDDMEKYATYQTKMESLMNKFKDMKIDNNINDTDDTDDTNDDNTFDFEDPLDNAFEYNNLIIVPSRLTSQWETEIVKYVKDKFNLRAKVLVGISSIKLLEKELHEFYEKQRKSKLNKEKTNSKAKSTAKSTAKNGKIILKESNKKIAVPNIVPSTDVSNAASLINPSNKIDIDNDIKINDGEEVDEDTKDTTEATENIKLSRIQINKMKKEQKIIEKLMKNAKKQNDKNILKTKVEIPIEKPIENTLENIINGDDEDADMIDGNSVIENERMEQNETESLTDKYDFVNKYIEERNQGSFRTSFEKESGFLSFADIYIVSINLLSNENYLNYICHNQYNHLKPHINGETKRECNINKINKIKTFYSGPPQICRLTDKFNIFKIKWNRVILDEAHENLIPVVKLFSTSLKKFINGSSGMRIHTEDQFLFENLCVINSNYKWAMTGTPTQNGIDNLMGILEFLTKKNYEESLFAKIEKIRFLSDIVGISKDNMDSLLDTVLKKTMKKDVKTLLNIPIFTEEIIYVEQTNIERNIYNTIRCSRHFTEAVRIRRLFLMCTNILINEGYDLDNNNEIVATEALTLEQLNANMITKFNQQLKLLEQNKLRIDQMIEQQNLHILDWNKISNYVDNYFRNLADMGVDNIIDPEILQELYDKFGDLERPIVKSQCEIFYNIMNVFELWKEPSNIIPTFMDNINMIKEHLFRIWKINWNTNSIYYKCAEYGSKLGEIKIQEDISKKQKQLETIANDNKRINNQIALFSNNEFLKEKTSDPCIICFEDLTNVVVTPCRHIFCLDCTKKMSNDLKSNFTCPECRSPLNCNTVNITTVANINATKNKQDLEGDKEEKDKIIVDNKDNKDLTEIEQKLGADWKNICINKYGSKMYEMVKCLNTIFENKENRVIIFSQYSKMLSLIGVTLEEFKIKFVHCSGNNYVLNRNINKFKTDDSYRVIMLSAENANSGANLVVCNHLIIIDVLYDNIEKVKAMESQIIGRVVRLGQQKSTKILRFITKGTIEEEHFNKTKYDINILQN